MKQNSRDYFFENILEHSEQNIKGFFYEYRPLSNFHIASVPYDGLVYTSNEHAYQAAKYPRDRRYECLKMTPAQVKVWGQQAPVNIPDWNGAKRDIMFYLNLYKFTKHLDLKKLLIDTGDRYLEESNYWGDAWWGVVYKEGYAGRGDSNLGKILMEVRTLIQ